MGCFRVGAPPVVWFSCGGQGLERKRAKELGRAAGTPSTGRGVVLSGGLVAAAHLDV